MLVFTCLFTDLPRCCVSRPLRTSREAAARVGLCSWLQSLLLLGASSSTDRCCRFDSFLGWWSQTWVPQNVDSWFKLHLNRWSCVLSCWDLMVSWQLDENYSFHSTRPPPPALTAPPPRAISEKMLTWMRILPGLLLRNSPNEAQAYIIWDFSVLPLTFSI